MGRQHSSGLGQSSINGFFIGWTIAIDMAKRIFITRHCQRAIKVATHLTYFNDFEKSPVCSRIVVDQADRISPIKLTSTSDFSAITQLQTSIPDAIAEGVATPKGKLTK